MMTDAAGQIVPRDTQSVPLGRLVRIGRYIGDPYAALYVVACAEAAVATGVIRGKVGALGDEVEDLGSVTDELVGALNLKPGQYKYLK
jgi:hypothetical protein